MEDGSQADDRRETGRSEAAGFTDDYDAYLLGAHRLLEEKAPSEAECSTWVKENVKVPVGPQAVAPLETRRVVGKLYQTGVRGGASASPLRLNGGRWARRFYGDASSRSGASSDPGERNPTRASLSTAERYVALFSKVLFWIAGAGLVGMTALIVADVIGIKIFSKPVPGGIEFVIVPRGGRYSIRGPLHSGDEGSRGGGLHRGDVPPAAETRHRMLTAFFSVFLFALLTCVQLQIRGASVVLR